MSSAYTSILVGGAFLVSEILLPSKTANFPFLTMDYSPWSSKNLIDWNWLRKFIQLGVDVKCMHINFGWRGLSSFRDFALFVLLPFSYCKLATPFILEMLNFAWNLYILHVTMLSFL